MYLMSLKLIFSCPLFLTKVPLPSTSLVPVWFLLCASRIISTFIQRVYCPHPLALVNACLFFDFQLLTISSIGGSNHYWYWWLLRISEVITRRQSFLLRLKSYLSISHISPMSLLCAHHSFHFKCCPLPQGREYYPTNSLSWIYLILSANQTHSIS